MSFFKFSSSQKGVYFKVWSLILMTSFFVSCQDCTFESDNITFARVQFHDRTTKLPLDEVALDTTFISVRAVNEFIDVDKEIDGRATIDPTDKPTSKSLVYNLPLFTGDKFSTFIFTHDNLAQNQDTITFQYQVHLKVSTPDCGVIERIDSLKIFRTTFDSAVVIHKTIDLNNPHDVEIYLSF